MSLQDPVAVAQARAEQARGSVGSLIAAVVLAGLCLFAGAAAGWGFGIAADVYRQMSMNNVHAWENPQNSQWPLPAFAGLFGGIIARGLYEQTAARFRGGPVRISSFALVGTSAALALWANTPLWVSPTKVGEKVDTKFGGSEPWGFLAWVMYYSNYWIPAAILLVALIALVTRLMFVADLSKKKKARAERLVTGGFAAQAGGVPLGSSVAQGVVVSSLPVGGRFIRINGKLMSNVTLSFVDATGQARSVTKAGLYPHTQMPHPGDRVTVYYDPARVGDPNATTFTFVPVSIGMQLPPQPGMPMGQAAPSNFDPPSSFGPPSTFGPPSSFGQQGDVGTPAMPAAPETQDPGAPGLPGATEK